MYRITNTSLNVIMRADTKRLNFRMLNTLSRSFNTQYSDIQRTERKALGEQCTSSNISHPIITQQSILNSLKCSTCGKVPIKHTFAKYDIRTVSTYLHKSISARQCHTQEQVPCDTNKDAEEAFLQKARLSALYTDKQHSADEGAGGIVQVDLNLEARFGDVEALARNVEERQMTLDVHDMHDSYLNLLKIKEEMSNLESKKKSVAVRVGEIVKKKKTKVLDSLKAKDLESLKAKLIVEGKAIRIQMKENASRYNDQEEAVMRAALQLPADIHPSTPKEETLIEVKGTKIDLGESAKTHMQLAQEANFLILTGQQSGGYYLMGQLAQVQTDIETRAKQMLDERGFIPCECPDMVRKLVQEGCGKPIADPSKVFMIHTHGCDMDRELHDNPAMQMYLTGTSPQSFIAYLCAMEVYDKCLPLRFYSTGSHYAPKPTHEQLSLLNVPQANTVELCGVCKTAEDSEQHYEEFTNYLKEFYSQFDLHYRLVKMPASELEGMETARTEVQIWVPSEQTYVKAGQVSMWSDFVSRRLEIKSKQKYVHTVHCTLVRIPTLLTALIENSQKAAVEL